MEIKLASIGVIHSPYRQPQGTPVQPRWARQSKGTVELYPEFQTGLRDLDGFDRIWLVCWLDRTCPAELEVVPYLDTQTRGVFATRAPSRPNSIGLSCVRLLAVKGTGLHVAELDLLDETPLLDIKPYVPEFDVFDVKHVGWYANAGATHVADNRFGRHQQNNADER